MSEVKGGVHLLEISFRSGWKRLGAFALLAALLFWAWSHVVAQIRGIRMANVVDDAGRWQAALLEEPNQADLHTQLGYYYLNDTMHPDPLRAIEHFESAVRAHPYDYRGWTELGYAYDQQGRVDSAGSAYMTSVALAPNYAYPRWWWGNFLIRQGRVEQAFQEFARVVEGQPESVDDICRLIWHISGQDGAKLAAFG
ncbi:MAG: hypothetical protein HY650_14770, partial [Acidobacteria bacterium]|nr:hypothetical protein [Acidobacteriota bacterium]